MKFLRYLLAIAITFVLFYFWQYALGAVLLIMIIGNISGPRFFMGGARSILDD